MPSNGYVGILSPFILLVGRHILAQLLSPSASCILQHLPDYCSCFLFHNRHIDTQMYFFCIWTKIYALAALCCCYRDILFVDHKNYQSLLLNAVPFSIFRPLGKFLPSTFDLVDCDVES